MKLAVVLGQVVATVKHPGFSQDRLVVVDFIDDKGERLNNVSVAADALGAGVGEVVLVVQGSSARKTLGDGAPIDMSVIGIVDEVVIDNSIIYHK